MCNLAQCYAALGAYSRRRNYSKRAVMQEKLFGRHSPVLAPLCMDIAQCCEKLDDQRATPRLSGEGSRTSGPKIRAGRRQRRMVRSVLSSVPGARGHGEIDFEAAYWALNGSGAPVGVCAIMGYGSWAVTPVQGGS